jgi:hypothetical protein
MITDKRIKSVKSVQSADACRLLVANVVFWSLILLCGMEIDGLIEAN